MVNIINKILSHIILLVCYIHILQTCRGDLSDEGEIEGNQTVSTKMHSGHQPVTPITSHPHFFIMFSTTPGMRFHVKNETIKFHLIQLLNLKVEVEEYNTKFTLDFQTLHIY